jgi:hypothetical protein
MKIKFGNGRSSADSCWLSGLEIGHLSFQYCSKTVLLHQKNELAAAVQMTWQVFKGDIKLLLILLLRC